MNRWGIQAGLLTVCPSYSWVSCSTEDRKARESDTWADRPGKCTSEYSKDEAPQPNTAHTLRILSAMERSRAPLKSKAGLLVDSHLPRVGSKSFLCWSLPAGHRPKRRAVHRMYSPFYTARSPHGLLVETLHSFEGATRRVTATQIWLLSFREVRGAPGLWAVAPAQCKQLSTASQPAPETSSSWGFWWMSGVDEVLWYAHAESGSWP